MILFAVQALKSISLTIGSWILTEVLRRTDAQCVSCAELETLDDRVCQDGSGLPMPLIR